MRFNVEVDEMGRTILVLDEDFVEELQVQEGDVIPWNFIEDNLVLLEF